MYRKYPLSEIIEVRNIGLGVSAFDTQWRYYVVIRNNILGERWEPFYKSQLYLNSITLEVL